MQLQLIRHATLLLEYAGMRLLVDPSWVMPAPLLRHCLVTRKQLAENAHQAGVTVVIPKDGEIVALPKLP